MIFTKLVLFIALLGLSTARSEPNTTPELRCEDQYLGQPQETYAESLFAHQQKNPTTGSGLRHINSNHPRTQEFAKDPAPHTPIPWLDRGPGEIKYQIFPSKFSMFGGQEVEITFGTLTLDQFEYLKQKFGQGQSKLKFSPGYQYLLRDFLPPAFQIADSLENLGCGTFAIAYLEASETQTRLGGDFGDLLMDRLEDKNFFRRLNYGELLEPGDIVVSAMTMIPPPTSPSSGSPASRDYVFEHYTIYLDDNLSIGANPAGLQLAPIMATRSYKVNDPDGTTKVVPFGNLFRDHRFWGGHKALLPNGIQPVVFRRLGPLEGFLPRRKYEHSAAAMALAIEYDQMGRAKTSNYKIKVCD
jgi:hypothetical protein